MHQIKNETLGSDFEIFVRDTISKNILPVPGIFGGTKEDPLSIGQGCSRQVDGVAVELNTAVCKTKEDWVNSFEHCLSVATAIIAPMGLELVIKSSHVFNPTYFTCDRHTEFGCTPAYDAYSGKELHPSSDKAGNLRTTGAHIHIGFEIDPINDDLDEITRRLIFCMDKTVGQYFLQIDKDQIRRKLYGKAGEYRNKLIELDGTDIMIVEYRSLGGGALVDIDGMWNLTKMAIGLYNSEYKFTEEELELQRNKINQVETYDYAA
jgi:hypothetical protein